MLSSLTAPALLKAEALKVGVLKVHFLLCSLPLAAASPSWRRGLDPTSPLVPHPASLSQALVLNKAVFLLTGSVWAGASGSYFPEGYKRLHRLRECFGLEVSLKVIWANLPVQPNSGMSCPLQAHPNLSLMIFMVPALSVYMES